LFLSPLEFTQMILHYQMNRSYGIFSLFLLSYVLRSPQTQQCQRFAAIYPFHSRAKKDPKVNAT
ncbi:hypothetical protein, partial [Mitsuokella multacida]|uniref:hypothetical protein n=1 Tax=Mitsuokella multacida TaxID=52226 RepID=UPI0022E543A9